MDTFVSKLLLKISCPTKCRITLQFKDSHLFGQIPPPKTRNVAAVCQTIPPQDLHRVWHWCGASSWGPGDDDISWCWIRRSLPSRNSKHIPSTGSWEGDYPRFIPWNHRWDMLVPRKVYYKSLKSPQLCAICGETFLVFADGSNWSVWQIHHGFRWIPMVNDSSICGLCYFVFFQNLKNHLFANMI